MTNPEAVESIRYALLTNGSRFSRAILEQLLNHDFVPTLLVLPEYPPASVDGDILRVEPEREFLSMASDIELLYAPRQTQDRCAEQIRQREIDYILVACWPYLIDADLRECAGLASLNLHPSKLPRYRGADPLQQQIAANDRNAGVTLHLLDAQFDHGNIIGQREFEVDAHRLEPVYLETRCAKLGVELFIAALKAGQGSWQPVPQADQALDTD